MFGVTPTLDPLVGIKEGQRVGVTHASAHAARVEDYATFTTPATFDNGCLIVDRLGAVDSSHPAFHTLSFIYPTGYCSRRVFVSSSTAGKRAVYACRITTGPTGAPVFSLNEAHVESRGPVTGATLYEGTSPVAAFNAMAAKASEVNVAAGATGFRLPAMSAADFFGLTQPRVAMAIEGMPGAALCARYIFLEQRQAGAVGALPPPPGTPQLFHGEPVPLPMAPPMLAPVPGAAAALSGLAGPGAVSMAPGAVGADASAAAAAASASSAASGGGMMNPSAQYVAPPSKAPKPRAPRAPKAPKLGPDGQPLAKRVKKDPGAAAAPDSAAASDDGGDETAAAVVSGGAAAAASSSSAPPSVIKAVPADKPAPVVKPKPLPPGSGLPIDWFYAGPGPAPTPGGPMGAISGCARVEPVPEYAYSLLLTPKDAERLCTEALPDGAATPEQALEAAKAVTSTLDFTTKTLPPAVTKAVLLETLMWMGQSEQAPEGSLLGAGPSPSSVAHTFSSSTGVGGTPGAALSPLAGVPLGDGAVTPEAVFNTAAPWCSLPAAAVPDVLQAWEMLRLTSTLTGLDAVLHSVLSEDAAAARTAAAMTGVGVPGGGAAGKAEAAGDVKPLTGRSTATAAAAASAAAPQVVPEVATAGAATMTDDAADAPPPPPPLADAGDMTDEETAETKPVPSSSSATAATARSSGGAEGGAAAGSAAATLSPADIAAALEPLASPHALAEALAWDGSTAADPLGRKQRLLTAVFSTLTRFAVAHLPSLLGVTPGEMTPTLRTLLLDASSLRVDGDTWPEMLRRVLIACGQQELGEEMYRRYEEALGEQINEDGSATYYNTLKEKEGTGEFDYHAMRTYASTQSQLAKQSYRLDALDFVHMHRGRVVLSYFVGAEEAGVPEGGVLHPAASLSSAQMQAEKVQAERAASSSSAKSKKKRSAAEIRQENLAYIEASGAAQQEKEEEDRRARMDVEHDGAPTSVAPSELLWRPFDAYEYAHAIRSADRFAKTFPTPCPLVEPPGGGAGAAGAGSSPAAPDSGLSHVLAAATAAAEALTVSPVPLSSVIAADKLPAEIEASLPPVPPSTDDALRCGAVALQTAVVPPAPGAVLKAEDAAAFLPPHIVGTGAAVVAPSSAELEAAAAARKAEEARLEALPFPPRVDFRAALQSLRGLSTKDGNVDAAYTYGCVAEALEAVAEAIKLENKATRYRGRLNLERKRLEATGGAAPAAGLPALADAGDEDEEVEEDDEDASDDDAGAAGGEEGGAEDAVPVRTGHQGEVRRTGKQGFSKWSASAVAASGVEIPFLSRQTPLKRLFLTLRAALDMASRTDYADANGFPFVRGMFRYQPRGLDLYKRPVLSSRSRVAESAHGEREQFALAASRLRDAALFALRRYDAEASVFARFYAGEEAARTLLLDVERQLAAFTFKKEKDDPWGWSRMKTMPGDAGGSLLVWHLLEMSAAPTLPAEATDMGHGGYVGPWVWSPADGPAQEPASPRARAALARLRRLYAAEYVRRTLGRSADGYFFSQPPDLDAINNPAEYDDTTPAPMDFRTIGQRLAVAAEACMAELGLQRRGLPITPDARVAQYWVVPAADGSLRFACPMLRPEDAEALRVVKKDADGQLVAVVSKPVAAVANGSMLALSDAGGAVSGGAATASATSSSSSSSSALALAPAAAASGACSNAALETLPPACSAAEAAATQLYTEEHLHAPWRLVLRRFDAYDATDFHADMCLVFSNAKAYQARLKDATAMGTTANNYSKEIEDAAGACEAAYRSLAAQHLPTLAAALQQQPPAAPGSASKATSRSAVIVDGDEEEEAAPAPAAAAAAARPALAPGAGVTPGVPAWLTAAEASIASSPLWARMEVAPTRNTFEIASENDTGGMDVVAARRQKAQEPRDEWPTGRDARANDFDVSAQAGREVLKWVPRRTHHRARFLKNINEVVWDTYNELRARTLDPVVVLSPVEAAAAGVSGFSGAGAAAASSDEEGGAHDAHTKSGSRKRKREVAAAAAAAAAAAGAAGGASGALLPRKLRWAGLPGDARACRVCRRDKYIPAAKKDEAAAKGAGAAGGTRKGGVASSSAEAVFKPFHEETLLCEACNAEYHAGCLSPKIDGPLPDDQDWICPDCRGEPLAVRSVVAPALPALLAPPQEGQQIPRTFPALIKQVGAVHGGGAGGSDTEDEVADAVVLARSSVKTGRGGGRGGKRGGARRGAGRRGGAAASGYSDAPVVLVPAAAPRIDGEPLLSSEEAQSALGALLGGPRFAAAGGDEGAGVVVEAGGVPAQTMAGYPAFNLRGPRYKKRGGRKRRGAAEASSEDEDDGGAGGGGADDDTPPEWKEWLSAPAPTLATMAATPATGGGAASSSSSSSASTGIAVPLAGDVTAVPQPSSAVVREDRLPVKQAGYGLPLHPFTVRTEVLNAAGIDRHALAAPTVAPPVVEAVEDVTPLLLVAPPMPPRIGLPGAMGGGAGEPAGPAPALEPVAAAAASSSSSGLTPAPARSSVWDTVDLDAAPGAGGTHVEASVLLRIVPEERRGLWRLIALLSRFDFWEFPAPLRVRLLLELMMALSAVPVVSAHLEALAGAQRRATDAIAKDTDAKPPEPRAAMLARLGVPMPLIVAVKEEEAQRATSVIAPSAAVAALRPPRYVRELARWGPTLPPPAAIHAAVLAYAREHLAVLRVRSKSMPRFTRAALVRNGLLMRALPSDCPFEDAALHPTLGAFFRGLLVPRHPETFPDESEDGVAKGPAGLGAAAAAVPVPVPSSAGTNSTRETALEPRFFAPVYRPHPNARRFYNLQTITPSTPCTELGVWWGSWSPETAPMKDRAREPTAAFLKSLKLDGTPRSWGIVKSRPARKPVEALPESELGPDGFPLDIETGPWPYINLEAMKGAINASIKELPRPVVDPSRLCTTEGSGRTSKFSGVLSNDGKVKSAWVSRVSILRSARHIAVQEDEVTAAMICDLAQVILRSQDAAKRFLNFPELLDAYKAAVAAHVVTLPKEKRYDPSQIKGAVAAAASSSGGGAATGAASSAGGMPDDDGAAADEEPVPEPAPAPAPAPVPAPQPMADDDDNVFADDSQAAAPAAVPMVDAVAPAASPVPLAGVKRPRSDEAASDAADSDAAASDADGEGGSRSSAGARTRMVRASNLAPWDAQPTPALVHSGLVPAFMKTFLTGAPDVSDPGAAPGPAEEAALVEQAKAAAAGAGPVTTVVAPSVEALTAALRADAADAVPAADALAALIKPLSPSPGELVFLAGMEGDAGSAVGDACLDPVLDAGVPRGADEARRQKRATYAYAPPKLARDEQITLLRGVIEAWLTLGDALWHREAPGAAPQVGVLRPAVWLAMLAAYQVFPPGRTAAALRDRYDVLRQKPRVHWEAMWESALASAGAGSAWTNYGPLLPRGAAPPAWAATLIGAPLSPQTSATPALPLSEAATTAFSRLLTRLRPQDIAFRALTPAERCAEACRDLERTRALLEWDDKVLASELAASGIGGRPVVLGVDRDGARYVVVGGNPADVWVQPATRPPAIAVAKGKAGAVAALPPVALTEWRVLRTPAQLFALMTRLEPRGEVEGPLLEALTRRAPALLSAMVDAAQRAAFTQKVEAAAAELVAAASRAPEGGVPACLVCGDATCTAATAAAGAAPSLPTAHCPLCHANFVFPYEKSAATAAFIGHVKACWAAAAGAPVVRACAVASSRAAAAASAGAAPLPQDLDRAALAVLAATAAAEAGAPAGDVARALDPALHRAKQLLVSLCEAVDWGRLRNPAAWNPAARAAWVRLVQTSTSAGGLHQAVSILEAALRADAEFPLPEPHSNPAGAALVRSAVANVAAADPSKEPPAPDAVWRWLPEWYEAIAPTQLSCEAVPTVAAVVARAKLLASALLATLLLPAVPA